MAAALALASSLLWGSGDFLGGRASRTWPVLVVLAWAQLSMALVLWVAVGAGVALAGIEVTPRGVLLGMVGGVAGVIGLGAFYRALAIGPMSVVPPIAAAGVVLPVGVGLATGTDPTPLVLGGMLLAVVGVVLASIGEGHNVDSAIATRVSATTIGLCIVAASGFGVLFVALDAAAGSGFGSSLVAVAGVRLGSSVALVGAAIATRTRAWSGVAPRVALGFFAIGVLDTGANLVFAIAAAFGELAIVAVLASLYPAVTSGLAHVVLGERLGRLQLVGVVLALAGVAVLAAR